MLDNFHTGCESVNKQDDQVLQWFERQQRYIIVNVQNFEDLAITILV